MKFIDERINEYAISKSWVPSQVCNELEQYTWKKVEMPQMLIGKMEASFLGFLIRSLRVQNILEIGTFTGYSSLAMAENLPDQGTMTTLDISESTVKIAQDFWKKSPHGYKINSIVGPALDSLKDLNQYYDLIFIDADKENYLNYLKECLKILAPNGVIILDNTLWGGKVLSESHNDPATAGIKQVNDYIKQNPSLYSTLLPVRDGMMLVQRNLK